MRLAYTADLHGNLEAYDRLFELAITSEARAVIVGGDLLPHTVRRESAIAVQQAFIQQELRPLLETLQTHAPDIGVFLLPGNDDWAAAATELDQLAADGLAYPLHERVYDLAALGLSEAPLWLAGYACVPLTPFSIKDYERRDDRPLPAFDFSMSYSSWSGQIMPTNAAEISALPSIGESLALLKQQSDPARTIYACHTPPHATPLDAMAGGRHPGSRAMRSFIEQQQPLLTLHGHIHEAPQVSGYYALRIGSTWAANPGNNQQQLHAITLDTNSIQKTIDHTVFAKNHILGLKAAA